MGGGWWDWSTAVNWGRNTGIDVSTNVANLDRLDQTLDTSVCSSAPGAAIPCADYLGAGDVTQEVLDYILFTSRDTGGNEQKSFTANVSGQPRSEEHTSELQSLMRISYAVFCLKKKQY